MTPGNERPLASASIEQAFTDKGKHRLSHSAATERVLLHQLHLSGKLIASIEDTALDLRPNDVRQLNMKWSSTRLNHAVSSSRVIAITWPGGWQYYDIAFLQEIK
ncbi:hypothetical protein [Mesorhizobium sp. M5C.F.Ca.IN.020.29.1.1]|uniref:hypothetical protein n=1 Tax=Mesorhizobium sp. M5C.F.Ca.IN.020.29.1.1 TaxID=2496770 RepID=UPI001FE242CF|nr:hypothetical protein [Mesorhizobium sp. M5C.F.Ca.IN.020.29.1.1]